MSQPIDDGGPAFPRTGTDGTIQPQSGMTLRDWFAGQESVDHDEEVAWGILEALAGPRPHGTYQTNPMDWFAWHNQWMAAVRYARADAMIAARKGGAE